MEGPEAVQRATELIEQRLAQEEETEVGTRVKGIGEGGLQVKESICGVMEGREWLLCGYRQHAGQVFPGTQPGPFPHQDALDGVVGGERWGFSPSNRHLERADFPKTLPTHVG